jgi:hypothetical protein
MRTDRVTPSDIIEGVVEVFPDGSLERFTHHRDSFQPIAFIEDQNRYYQHNHVWKQSTLSEMGEGKLTVIPQLRYRC